MWFVISRYSGKCDLYDVVIEIHKYTLEELRNNVNIYIGDSREPLHIEKTADLIPYYPYIVGFAHYDNVKREAVIILSAESFVDKEEKDRLKRYLKQAIKIYEKCKHKKMDYIIDDVVSEIYWISDKEVIEEIVKRVSVSGMNANIDGLHTKMHEYYRQQLADEMERNGLNPADYGYERFVNGE